MNHKEHDCPHRRMNERSVFCYKEHTLFVNMSDFCQGEYDTLSTLRRNSVVSATVTDAMIYLDVICESVEVVFGKEKWERLQKGA